MSQDSFREKVLTELRAAAAAGTLPGLEPARVVDMNESVISPDGTFLDAIVVRDGAEKAHPRPVMPRPAVVHVVASVIVEWHKPLHGESTWLAEYRTFKAALRTLLTSPTLFIEPYAPIPPAWTWSADPSDDLSTPQSPGYHKATITGARNDRG